VSCPERAIHHPISDVCFPLALQRAHCKSVAGVLKEMYMFAITYNWFAWSCWPIAGMCFPDSTAVATVLSSWFVVTRMCVPAFRSAALLA
jgi:hypothetical protein